MSCAFLYVVMEIRGSCFPSTSIHSSRGRVRVSRLFPGTDDFFCSFFFHCIRPAYTAFLIMFRTVAAVHSRPVYDLYPSLFSSAAILLLPLRCFGSSWVYQSNIIFTTDACSGWGSSVLPLSSS